MELVICLACFIVACLVGVLVGHEKGIVAGFVAGFWTFTILVVLCFLVIFLQVVSILKQMD